MIRTSLRSLALGVTSILIFLLAVPVLASQPPADRSAAATVPASQSTVAPEMALSKQPARAAAAVRPVKLYTGIHQPLLVAVDLAPDATAAEIASLRLTLLEPATAKPVATAELPARPGQPGEWQLDLARVFAAQLKQPKFYYLQLLAGERKLGPAMILQPLLQPQRAVLDRRNPARPLAIFSTDAPGTTRAFSGFRMYIDKLVVIETERGTMRFRLRPDCAPNTAWTFRHLAEGGFFDGTDFFRTVAVGSAVGKGFVVQGGDPTLAEPYDGGPGFDLALEPSPLPHDYGVLSMARDTEPDTAGSQFFICLSREETARLDGQYSAFGQMVWPPVAPETTKPGDQAGGGPSGGTMEGLSPVEVLTTIANSPLLPGKKDRPAKPVRINSMRLIDAAPYGDGDKVVTLEGNKPGVR